MEQQRENLFWVDGTRALVMFGVVLAHVSADVITEWGRFPGSWWWAANLYDSLARGCVPVFVMVSGTLLLPKSESYRSFFLKRFRRILIPFVVWTALYLFWKKQFYLPGLGFSEAFSLAVNGGVHFHLWFIYLIVGLYLLTPILRILVAHARRRDLLYFLILWFLVSSVSLLGERWDQWFLHSGFRFKISLEMVQGFTGYFILGYLIRTSETLKLRSVAWGVWIVSFGACALGTYYLSRHFQASQIFLYDNMAPNVVFYAASFFMIMKHAGLAMERRLSEGVRRFILSLSKASLGIYLVHPMIQEALAKGRWGFVLKADLPHPAWMIPLTAVTIYALSFLAIFFIQKIPVLKRIT